MSILPNPGPKIADHVEADLLRIKAGTRGREDGHHAIAPPHAPCDVRVVTRVRNELRSLEAGTPTLNEVASRLHLSDRTLRRRLNELGTSFREILDDVRFGIAAERLHQRGTTNDSLAEMLGYADTANFRRAFKRWAGHSPRAYRRTLEDGSSPVRPLSSRG